MPINHVQHRESFANSTNPQAVRSHRGDMNDGRIETFDARHPVGKFKDHRLVAANLQLFGTGVYLVDHFGWLRRGQVVGEGTGKCKTAQNHGRHQATGECAAKWSIRWHPCTSKICGSLGNRGRRPVVQPVSARSTFNSGNGKLHNAVFAGAPFIRHPLAVLLGPRRLRFATEESNCRLLVESVKSNGVHPATASRIRSSVGDRRTSSFDCSTFHWNPPTFAWFGPLPLPASRVPESRVDRPGRFQFSICGEPPDRRPLSSHWMFRERDSSERPIWVLPPERIFPPPPLLPLRGRAASWTVPTEIRRSNHERSIRTCPNSIAAQTEAVRC
jgi:hypothetical protein